MKRGVVLPAIVLAICSVAGCGRGDVGTLEVSGTFATQMSQAITRISPLPDDAAAPTGAAGAPAANTQPQGDDAARDGTGQTPQASATVPPAAATGATSTSGSRGGTGSVTSTPTSAPRTTPAPNTTSARPTTRPPVVPTAKPTTKAPTTTPPTPCPTNTICWH